MEWDEQSLGEGDSPPEATPTQGCTVRYLISIWGEGGRGRGVQWALQLPRRRGTLYLGTDGVSRWGCVVGSLEMCRGTVGVRRGK